jgi:GNAT superfamily N-acetyltransferase
MIRIQDTTAADYPTIQNLAHRTWPHTFGTILSKEQIAYMLEWMYSLPALQEQVEKKGHRFLLAMEGTVPLGFASYEHKYKQEPVTRIHKLYVLPDIQGKGIGKLLIHHIGQLARQHASQALNLNVNRYNAAVAFYQHMGFKIVREENIAIGEGFLMEDYVMQKELE